MGSVPKEIQESIESLKNYASQSEEARVEVRSALELATSEIQTPFDQLHEVIFAQPALASALKSCLNMNLFALWDAQGNEPKTAHELAKLSGSDPVLLARLLRHLAAMNKIKEVGRDTYVLTPFAQAMGKPGVSNGINLLYHSTWPALQHLPVFLTETKFQNPVDPAHTSWQHLTGSKLGFIEQLQQDAGDRLVDFQNVMVIYANNGNWTNLYPTERLLENYDPSTTLLLDAGGGKGQDLARFLEKHPKPGKDSLILQELSTVIDTVPFDHLDDSIRLMAHNLFDPQPIKGARAYFTHSVFHGFTSGEAVTILKNLAAAMTKGYSKLLLNEKVVPAEKATRTATTGDLMMMSSVSASERTQSEWESLLKQAGLRIIKIWVTPIYSEAIIEAEL